MKLSRLFVTLFFTILLAASCGEDDSTSPGDITDGTGTLSVSLIDAPAVYDSVKVSFSEVAVHFGLEEAADNDTTAAKTAGEWIVISGEEQTFDLLTLTDGATGLLGEAELAVGHYTQLRLILSGAEVGIDGEVYPLSVPSSTVKFVSGFEVTADETTELLVDFDADRSVHQTGNGQYKLQPTIRLIHEKECGRIVGTVTNYENEPLASAIIDGETVTTSPVNPENGHFTLPGLTPGTYTVLIVDTQELEYESPPVEVTAGEQTDLGEITLQ